MKLNSLRLNPFEFPGNTEFRFILLIVAVTGASLFIYADFYNSVIWNKTSEFSPGICALCMLGGSILTLSVAVVIYWWLPDWKIKKERMRSLKDRDTPDLVGYLHELSREAGLIRLPSFFWGVLDQTKEGYAFGRWGRLCVYLPNGLVNSFEENLPEFRAILFHELAHIYNGDVHRTYLSFTVWWAFLITALPTFVITLLRSSWERILGMSGRVLVLFLLIYLMRNAVLRVREFYADLRASIWDQQSSALRLALESAERSSEKRGFWQRIWLTHPDLGDRRRILDNPTPLLQMGFWDAFTTGMATMIPFAGLISLAVFTLLSVTDSPSFMQGLLMFFVPAFFCVILIIYIIGAGTWRTTFVAVACGKPVQGINRLGVGLALGMVVGWKISFIGASQFSSFPLALLLSTGLVLIGITGFVEWVAAGAMVWLPIAATTQSPRIFYRWGIAIAGIILSSLFVGLFMRLISLNAQFLFESITVLDLLSSESITVLNPFTSFALIGLWAFPLSSWFWRRRIENTPVSEWLFLDSPSQPITLPQQIQLKPTLALIVGLLGGLVGHFFVFILVVLGSNIALFIFLSVCIQVLVAGLVAAWMRSLGSIHGLFSASIAAFIIASGVFIHTNLNLAGALFLGTRIFNTGGLVAVPTVVIASGIGKWLRNSKRFRVKSVGN
ncbi:M48 family metalloprotease [Moorena sp. SIO3H5]|uniref:M48 family metalloprotease n=1 Tax=Moorena sp. SIO3H5 TaxID=2607834 RepID=UPI0013B99D18|nr:M48 family metalloprotease [Moorena sp. SIO3H5]NEO70608.1 M48 family metalloprotease [Moorena sp. SIO3H5]